MPGLPEPPYRLPCGRATWPASGSALALCTSHKLAREMAVPERCNTQRREDTPAWIPEGTCPSGTTWKDGNCYGPCPESDVTDAITGASTLAIGATLITLGGGCGTIYGGDRVKFGTDPTEYTVRTSVASADCAPTTLSGFFFYIDSPGLITAVPGGTAITVVQKGTRDLSQCEKLGWKAVRAVAYQDGRPGFLASCGETCDTSGLKYRTITRTASYSLTQEPPLPSYSKSYTRTLTVSTATGLVTQSNCTDDDGGVGDQDPFVTSPKNELGCLLFGDWACGPSFGPGGGAENAFNTLFAEAYAAEDHTAAGTIEGTYYEVEIVTMTDDELVLHVESGPNVWDSTWTLSSPYSVADALADAWTLADRWDLSDDLVYPWRTYSYGPWGDYHLPVPLVAYRRVAGAVSPDVSLPCATIDDCGGVCSSAASDYLTCFAACAGDPECEADCADTYAAAYLACCPYDGAIVGTPLPAGTGGHYGFGDAGIGFLDDLEWNPGFGLPATATWWTKYTGPETLFANFPPGGFILVSAGTIYVQKWVEIQPATPSANFARPCGADRADYPTAWPICGRVAVAGQVADGPTVTVTLTDAAPHLLAGDSVDLVTYGPAPDFTATVLATVTVLAVVDDQHFTFTGTTNAATHAKSTGSPHYRWHDDRSKGDFIFCTSETNLCTAVETLTCADDCLPANPCAPAVMAVLGPDSPEIFTNGADLRLPATPSYHNGVRYVIHPRGYEPDPLYVGAGTAPSIESRCAPPSGASFPVGKSYAGCGDWV